MNRQEANLKILDLLKLHVNDNPDTRFGQMLFNLGIIEFASKSPVEEENYDIRDPHSDESVETLSKVYFTLLNNK